MSGNSSGGFVTAALILTVAALTVLSLQIGSLLRGITAAELLMERIESRLEPLDE
ncbi:MAG: hypothetical protein ACLFPW_09255 [Spirochaetaceae bacterium]